jgi:putative ABC transport system permease protein
MNRLVIGNLLHRPLRSSISILAVAIEVTMILAIVGIMVGMIQGSRTQTNGIGADLIVRPPNQTFLVGVSGAPAPAKIADVLRKLPHVVVASPVIQQISTQTAVETIWGIDYQSFNALRPFVFLSGGPFQDPNDVIVDDFFARGGIAWVTAFRFSITPSASAVSSSTARAAGSSCPSRPWALCWELKTTPRSST